MTQELKNLWRYRELLWVLAQRDIKLRYKQSFMGVAWALLMPAIMVGAGIVIRQVVTRSTSTGPLDLATVIVKSLPWTFFIASVRFGTMSLVGNSNLVSKVAFPKEVFPLAAILASGFDSLVALVVAVPILIYLGLGISLYTLWLLPLIAILVALTTGLCLILAAGNLFFRDVKYIVEVILTFAIFFTPVLYDVSMLGQHASLALLNPVAPLLEGLRLTVVEGRPPQLGWVGYSAVVSVLLLIFGFRFFKQMEYLFAERI